LTLKRFGVLQALDVAWLFIFKLFDPAHCRTSAALVLSASHCSTSANRKRRTLPHITCGKCSSRIILFNFEIEHPRRRDNSSVSRSRDVSSATLPWAAKARSTALSTIAASCSVLSRTIGVLSFVTVTVSWYFTYPGSSLLPPVGGQWRLSSPVLERIALDRIGSKTNDLYRTLLNKMEVKSCTAESTWVLAAYC
jgi:hypothetical protein